MKMYLYIIYNLFDIMIIDKKRRTKDEAEWKIRQSAGI